MNEKPNARELLKEARAELAKAHDHLMELTAKLPMQYFSLVDGNIIQAEDCLISQLDAYLATPSEGAMEMARAIEAAIKPQYIESPNGRGGVMVVSKDYTAAAALIEGLQRRVPRAMLEDINDFYLAANDGGRCYANDGTEYKSIDEIAAKHGVEPF